MLWNPFLMKKWLKNEVCGIRKQYTGALFTGEYSKVAAWKKKKKIAQIGKRRHAMWIQAPPKLPQIA